MYKSQANQDKWVLEMLKNKQNGYFLDIGAYNGVDISNTYILEKKFNWDGLCIEADEKIYYELSKNRKVTTINCAVTNKNGYVNFTSNDSSGCISENGAKVITKTLKTIMEEHSCPKIIDYISLDIEGAEVLALQEFPFDKHEFRLMTVEHNLYLGDKTNKYKIMEILLDHGYVLYKEDIVNVGNDPFEDWYIKPYLLNI